MEDKKYTSGQLLNTYKSLPDQLKEAVTSEQITEELNQLFSEYTISEDRQREINKKILYLLLQLESTFEFTSSVSKISGLAPDKSIEFAKKIIDDIFSDVKTYFIDVSTTINNEAALRQGARPAAPAPIVPTLPKLNMVDNKLAGTVRMPKEDITVSDSKLPVLQVMAKTPDELKKQEDQIKKQSYPGFDPYREQAK